MEQPHRMSGWAEETLQASASYPSAAEGDPALGCRPATAEREREGLSSLTRRRLTPAQGSRERERSRASGTGQERDEPQIALPRWKGTAGSRCTAPFLTTPRSWAQTFQPRRTSLGQRPFPLADSLFTPPPRNKKGCPMMEHHFQEQAGRRASYAKDVRTIPTPEGFHIQGCVSPAQCSAMKQPPSWYGKAALVRHSACTNYSIRQSILAQVKHCSGKPAVCLPRHCAG